MKKLTKTVRSAPMMRIRLAVLVAVFGAGVALEAADGVTPPRAEIMLNNGWMFHQGEVGEAEAAGFDDSGWEKVGLPHSASIPYWVDQIKVYEGDAWYRKRFRVEDSMKGKRVAVEFGGAFQRAWVYLNGKLIGEHKGGFTGFQYDLTPALRFGGENVLAVRVRNGWDARIAPRAGDSIFPNSLKANVRLIVTNPQHVAWCGQFISTPHVSDKSASVRVESEIRNEDPVGVKGSLMVEVLDASGKVVSTTVNNVGLPSGKTTVVAQSLPPISNPELWSPDRPYLYNVRTRLVVDGKVVDEYHETLGLRWFEFTQDKGFSLNGKQLYLWGYNVHEDRAGWAFAGTDAAMRRDMEIMKKAGANCIRACHNPHPRSFYKACDELGLLVWDELHFWGRGGFKGGEEGSYMAEAYPTNPADKAAFEANLLENLRSWIRANRNHPSIIVWSLGNETVMQMPPALEFEVEHFFRNMNVLAKQLDPYRPTGIGHALHDKQITDISGHNGGGPQKKVGTSPIMTTECRPNHVPTPDPWRSGSLVWSGFSYGTHCSHNGKTFGLIHGVFDYNRLINSRGIELLGKTGHLGAFEHATAEGKPHRLTIESDKSSIRNDGTDDTLLVIGVRDENGKLIKNEIPFTLKIVSGPGVLPTGRTWESTTASLGRQAIEFRSYDPGTTVLEVTSPGLSAVRHEITTIGVAKDTVVLK